MHYLKIAVLGFVLQVWLTPGYANNVEDKSEIWQGIAKGQYFAIMRHALAPGVGDPDAIDLLQCDTQRNLSAEGLAQAKRIGDRFRANGISSAEVYSSQWCRCRDTATALNLGLVKELKSLNSFFRDFDRRAPQTTSLLNWVQNRSSDQALVLVTHQVNISALLGVGATSGEIVAFKLDDDGVAVLVGSIATP